MADSEKILKTDIAEPGAVSDGIQKEFSDLIKFLDEKVQPEFIKSAKILQDAFSNVKLGGATLSEMQKINQALKETDQLEQAANKTRKLKAELTNQQLAQAQIDKTNKRDDIALIKAQIIEMDKSVGTLQRLEAANARLRLERKQLVEGDKDYDANLKRINQSLDTNNAKIVANSDKLKQQKLNVGNYANSIRDAFSGTGILGDAVNKYLGIIVLLSEKIEGLISTLSDKKVAEEAATAATKENSAAQETNAIVTDVAISAEEKNVVALESQTAATETASAATKGLGASLKALATNPYVLAAIAVAALAKVVYDNITATQAQQDAWDANEAGLKAWAKAITIAGVDADELRKAVKELTYAEFARQDLDIQALIIKKNLRAEAALARSQAMEEGKTIRERILLLQEFVDKTKQASELQKDELQRDVEIKQKTVEAYGKLATREQRRQLQEAIAALKDVEIETADQIRRSQKQITTLTQKYNDDLRKMNQDARKEEIEAIDTYSANKVEEIENVFFKELALQNLETKQKISDRKKEQDELGVVDKKGISHAKEFKAELDAIQKLGYEKNIELLRKKNDAIDKINDEEEKKLSERNAKQSDLDFKNTSAKIKEQESAEILAIDEAFVKKQDHSAKAEEARQKAILAVKIKYLRLDQTRNSDNPEVIANDETKINELNAEGLLKDDELEVKSAKEAAKQLLEIQKGITEGIAEGLQKRNELQQESNQLEIDSRKRATDIEAKLAAGGKNNDLAQEQALTAKAEEKKIADAKKAQKQKESIALVEAFMSAFQNSLDKDGDPLKALTSAFASEAALKAAISTLVSGYHEGTDSLTSDGAIKLGGGKDNLLIRAEEGERIFGVADSAKVKGKTNKQIIDSALMFENVFLPQFNSQNASTPFVSHETHDHKLGQIINTRLASLESKIENMPHEKIEIDGLFKLIKTVTTGSRTDRYIYKANSRRSMRQSG